MPFKLTEAHVGKKVLFEGWGNEDYLLVEWVNDEPDQDGVCLVGGVNKDGVEEVYHHANEEKWEELLNDIQAN